MTTPPEQQKARTALAAVISIGLGLVVIAPIALSSQHIYSWARDPSGLDLSVPFAVLAFVALDLAATVCVCMTIYSGLRGEGAGIFGILTWAFAAGSAWVNWKTAESTPSPLDGPFFASMSIAGPVLLEATLAKVKRWARVAGRTAMSARPKFGQRWLPGVALRETMQAWAAARREGIGCPEDAIAHVRERRALADMTDADAVRYSWSALGVDHSCVGTDDVYAARLWLQSRGRAVTQAAVDEVAGPTAAGAFPPVRVVMLPPTTYMPRPDEPSGDAPVFRITDIPKADAIRYAVDATGSEDPGDVVAWLEDHGRTDVERKRVSEVVKKGAGRHARPLSAVPDTPPSQSRRQSDASATA